mmetsp:Transcript_23569/g.73756  ORF Transcript_23569/g.73756 Transcript_23569/m.73756 type:complete len:217 (+) Transcript_23569:153-803(+)
MPEAPKIIAANNSEHTGLVTWFGAEESRLLPAGLNVGAGVPVANVNLSLFGNYVTVGKTPILLEELPPSEEVALEFVEVPRMIQLFRRRYFRIHVLEVAYLDPREKSTCTIKSLPRRYEPGTLVDIGPWLDRHFRCLQSQVAPAPEELPLVPFIICGTVGFTLYDLGMAETALETFLLLLLLLFFVLTAACIVSFCLNRKIAFPGKEALSLLLSGR